MAPIDLTLMTYHAQAERAERFNLIEKTVAKMGRLSPH